MSVVDILTARRKLVDDFLLKMLRLGASAELYEIVKHQIITGGKRVRPAMTILCCEAVGGSAEDAIPAAACIELVHNYTLIFDDIIDQSDLRRGLPTVRAKYGDVMAILAGMHYRETIYEAARRSPKSERIEKILSLALRRIIEGERFDVLFEQAGRESEYVKKMMYKAVDEKDYFRMIKAKTATLFEAACKVGGLVGNGDPGQVEALSRFGRNCGVAFQIVDDILDIGGRQGELGKEIGKDAKEHKLGNIVVLFSLDELSEAERDKLLHVLRSFRLSDFDVKEAIGILLSTNALKRAWEASREFITKAKSNLDVLTGSEAKRMLMDIADFLTERSF